MPVDSGAVTFQTTTVSGEDLPLSRFTTWNQFE